ncbi:MAG: hypothetical protein ACRDTT_29550, partial [Pseudonocardiaceae bacterium]
MSFRVVNIPKPIILVPSGRLEEQVRRQSRDHAGLPVDPQQLEADLNARVNGVATIFSEPRQGGGRDWSLLVHGQTYVARLFLTKYRDAYTIAALTPLRLRDHHRLGQGCLLIRPRYWQVVFDVQQIPERSDAGWSQLVAEWDQLTNELAQRRSAPVLSAQQGAFLDMLDQMVDVIEQITTEEARSARPVPYRRVAPTGERRYGTRAIYEFRLASGQ